MPPPRPTLLRPLRLLPRPEHLPTIPPATRINVAIPLHRIPRLAAAEQTPRAESVLYQWAGEGGVREESACGAGVEDGGVFVAEQRGEESEDQGEECGECQ